MIGRRFSRKTKIVTLLILNVIIIVGIAVLTVIALQKPPQTTGQSTQAQSAPKTPKLEAPTLKSEVVMAGLKNPWDVAFLPDKSILVTERGGRLVHQIPGQQAHTLAQIADVRARGEGGLMGLEIDRDFAKNRYIYTCYAAQSNDVRLVRWVLADSGLTSRKDIVIGIPLNQSGRHSGCRVKMDANKVLWIGTGDATQASHPQDPKSLGGKILRVTREGAAAPGNLGGQFDPRIYSYGHRNTQGIALFGEPKNGVAGFSVEHGPTIDDEVNKLVKGNFGWDPTSPYIENVAMTDKKKYPDAIEAAWSSGDSTIAVSGATFLTGSQWQAWEGALAVAALKGQQLRLQTYDDKFGLTHDEALLQNQFGRLRSTTMGSDGNLYLTTDNSSNDQIIRITPQ